jgi:5'-3' exoribonuclease 2
MFQSIDRIFSVYYELPKSNHIHKSMLLRGVKFPTRALDQNDIEATKGRAARSGRNHGGAPLRSDYGGRGGRGRGGSFNYASQNSYSRPQSYNDQSYGSNNGGYNGRQYPPQQQAQSWQPPPPGLDGFARGPPPPPPGSNAAYSQGQGYYNHGPPPSAPPHNGLGGSIDRRNTGRGGPNQGPPGGYGRY